MRRVLTALLMVGAACSGGGPVSIGVPDLAGAGTPPAAPAQAPAETVDRPVEHGSVAADQIVLIDANGNLVVVNADGSNERVLAAADEAQVTSPVWAPDGARIAWTEIKPAASGAGLESSLVTANIDGSDPTRIMTPFASFYSYWDPSSTAVAFLGNAGPGLVGLGVASADVNGEAVAIDSADRYYMVWDPTGTTLVAHVGDALIRDDSLKLVVPSGPTNALTIGRGLYQNPGVTGGEGEIVFAEGDAAFGEIKLGNTDTGAVTTMLAYQGRAWIEVDPTGERVAVQTTGNADNQQDPEGGGQTASLDVSVVAQGIDVIDIATGAVARVSDDLAAAFFWSPDGARLLVATFERIDGAIWLQWRVWDGDELELVGEPFRPSELLGTSVMPFFDQYSVSHQLWAPDSERFTYSGTARNGQSGAWVVDTVSRTATLVAEDAQLSFWSPT